MNKKYTIKNLSIRYDEQVALSSTSLDVYANEILGVIGPSNSGKTSFLRTLNRMIELNFKAMVEGEVLIDKKDIITELTVEELRKRVGMVFASPICLPMSIYENIVYGPRRHGKKNKEELDHLVEDSLKASYLWDEVKNRLHTSALRLSGGQQQRLCIARSLANDPEVILFDEPCSGLDPISTAKVEEALIELKQKYTIIFVTNNVKQAARISDRVAFFLMGQLIELDQTQVIFTSPNDKRTEDYVSGRFG